MREMRRDRLTNDEPLGLREQTFCRHGRSNPPTGLADGLEVGILYPPKRRRREGGIRPSERHARVGPPYRFFRSDFGTALIMREQQSADGAKRRHFMTFLRLSSACGAN